MVERLVVVGSSDSEGKRRGFVFGLLVLAFSLLAVSCGDDDSPICRQYCDKFVDCACGGNEDACLQGCLDDCAGRDMGQACMEEFIAADCDVPSC